MLRWLASSTIALPPLAFLAACQAPESGADNRPAPTANAIFDAEATFGCPDLYRQISNRPEADARARLARGDRRILADEGAGFVAPGLTQAEATHVLDLGPTAFRLLTGFGDAFDDNTCVQFMHDGTIYMERYNRALLAAGALAADARPR